MSRKNRAAATVAELVAAFVDIAVRQGEALEYDDVATYNRLYPHMKSVVEELKRRDGDQRKALVPLYAHGNMQVRLAAARNTVAVAPQAARDVLRAIRDSRWPPQALHAGMALFALDEGIAKPT